MPHPAAFGTARISVDSFAGWRWPGETRGIKKKKSRRRRPLLRKEFSAGSAGVGRFGSSGSGKMPEGHVVQEPPALQPGETKSSETASVPVRFGRPFEGVLSLESQRSPKLARLEKKSPAASGRVLFLGKNWKPGRSRTKRIPPVGSPFYP